MALSDILARIERDALAEAEVILAEARAEAERLRAAAERGMAERRSGELERARREAREEARTRVASARLRGRDRTLAEKRSFLDRVMADVVAAIETLPDAEYAALLARTAALSTREGEVVEVGRADADRLTPVLPDALAAAGVAARVGGATDAIERGILVRGDRMSVDVSAAAIVAVNRAELDTVASRVLFSEEDPSK